MLTGILVADMPNMWDLASDPAFPLLFCSHLPAKLARACWSATGRILPPMLAADVNLGSQDVNLPFVKLSNGVFSKCAK